MATLNIDLSPELDASLQQAPPPPPGGCGESRGNESERIMGNEASDLTDAERRIADDFAGLVQHIRGVIAVAASHEDKALRIVALYRAGGGPWVRKIREAELEILRRNPDHFVTFSVGELPRRVARQEDVSAFLPISGVVSYLNPILKANGDTVQPPRSQLAPP